MKTCSYCGNILDDDSYTREFFRNSDTNEHNAYRFCNNGHAALFYEKTKNFLIPVNRYGHTPEEQNEVDRLNQIEKEKKLALERKKEYNRQVAENKSRNEYFGSERGFYDALTKKIKKK